MDIHCRHDEVGKGKGGDMRGRVKESLVNHGRVASGRIISGEFEVIEGYSVRKVDTECTCGGRPKIRVRIDGRKIRYESKAKKVGDNGVVRRVVIIEFTDGIRQTVSFKYEVI